MSISTKAKPKVARIPKAAISSALKPSHALEPVPELECEPARECEPTIISELDLGNFEQIIHLSDIHIRPLQRHDEYRLVFTRVLRMIKDQAAKPSVIALTGDLFDHKTVFRPETFKMCRDMLKMLGQVAPVLVIAGNHDMLEQNTTTRLDSLTPVIDDIPNIYYLKSSGLYQSVKTNDCFVVSSLYDKQFIRCPMKTGPSYICLYHGDITGAHETDESNLTSTLTSTRHRKKADFNGFNAVLLGDIHEFQVMKNDCGGYMSYAGSLIQQNHGESIKGHGFSVWRRASDGWSMPVHYDVPNDYGYIDIHCDNGKWFTDDEIPKHAYARLLIRDCTQTQLDIIMSEIKRATPEGGSLVITKKHAVSVNRTEEITDAPDPDQARKEDEILLILDQAKEQGMDGSALVNLHMQYQSQVDRTVCMSTAVWRPVWAEFKNLFGYGGGSVNYIRFKRGLTSITAGNACGKSSAVNALLFGIFGRVPLNPSSTSATYDVVNNRETGGYVKVLLNHGGVYYLIERVSCKPKGKTTAADLQRLTKYDFTCEIWESNLNGDKLVNRCDTRQNNNDTFIAELFGELSDFSLTNLLNKESSLDLLSMTPADQIKTLKSLFKMDVYDAYRDLNKKRITELEAAITKLRVRLQSFRELLDPDASEENVEALASSISMREGDIEEEEENLQLLHDQLQDLQMKIKGTPLTLTLNESLEELQQELDELGVPEEFSGSSAVLKVKLDSCESKIAAYEKELKESPETQVKTEQDLIDLEAELEELGVNPTVSAAIANKRLGAINARLDDIDMETELEEAESIAHEINKLKGTLITWALHLKLDNAPLDEKIAEPMGPKPDTEDISSLKRQVKELQSEIKKRESTKMEADADTSIESLFTSMTPGVPTHFTSTNAVELRKKESELKKLKLKLDEFKEIVITDTEGVINELCDCPLIDEAGTAMYDLSGDYRLVQDQLMDRLITHFENENERTRSLELVQDIASLEQQISHLNTVKLNAELMSKVEWLECLDFTQCIFNLNEWIAWLVQDAKIKETEAIRHNELVLEQISELQANLKIAEARLAVPELKQQQEELNMIIDYYEIQDDIKATKRCLALQRMREDLESAILIREELKEQFTSAVNWERYCYLSRAIEQYEDYRKAERLKPELAKLQREQQLSKQNLVKFQQEVRKMHDDHARMKLKLEQQAKYQQETTELSSELIAKEQDLKFHNDYNILMGTKGIASKMLFHKIKSIEVYINSILRSFTRYTVTIIFDDKKQTMHIVAEDSETNRALSTARFSGYEKLILQIAFKRALNKYSYNSKSSLIIIDEALDCIDGENFHTRLPEVMNLITQDYSTCLAISQRDISHISDINLTVHRENGYSFLGN